LGGTDEIVLRQPIDSVGAEANPAGVIANLKIRVVPLPVGDPGDGIDEGHGLVEILEGEGLVNHLPLPLPGVQLPEQIACGFFGQWWHPLLARTAVTVDKGNACYLFHRILPFRCRIEDLADFFYNAPREVIGNATA
jgi:hypothetical protein